MAQATPPNTSRETPFSAEDSLMHTTKYAERAFGVPLEQIGTVRMDGSKAALIISIDGIEHTVHWSRQPGGELFWFADGSDTPIRLGPGRRALADLRAALA
jgi:hypothetical protein